MKFLEKVYEASKLERKASNVEIYKAGTELNLKIEIGDNFNWCESSDEQEQAISLDSNLIELFKLKNIDYNEDIASDFFNLAPNESFETYIKDESGVYRIAIYVGHLDVQGVGCLNYWIDFNDMKKVSQ